jgi:hypothetical protein
LAAVCLVLLLLGTAAGSGPGAGVGATSAAAGGTAGPVPQATPDGFDSTVFNVTVYENGSARWSLRYVRRLDNASEEATFESFAAEFEAGESALASNFRTRAERLTAFGTNATGRSMAATGFDRRAFVEPSVGGSRSRGVVELSFLWTNFARSTGDSVVVDDVFDGGLYVGPDQRLEFRHGPGLAFDADAAEPPPDAGTGDGGVADSDVLTYFGERTFADSRPRVEFVPADSGGAGSDGSGANDGSNGAGTPDDGANDGSNALVAVGLLLVVGVVGAVAWYTGALSTGPGPGRGDDGGAEAESTPAGGPEATAADAGASAPPVSEEELLSDEDRVLRLLEENGGRMKQVAIVDATEWSKSKVSMLLSEMEENDEISKLRVGRENIISLAGEEPEAAGSPFDEE